jgi:hypothetical protein
MEGQQQGEVMLYLLIAQIIVCLGVAWLLVDPLRRTARDWLNKD